MRVHVKKISVSPRLYEELVELSRKKGDTVNQIAADLLTAGLKKNSA
jgi:hypothetical protein